MNRKNRRQRKNASAVKIVPPVKSNVTVSSERDKEAENGQDQSPGQNKSGNKSLLPVNSVKCGICNGPNRSMEWLIQCDDCDVYYHFECVKLTDIGPEEQWSCPSCEQCKNSRFGQHSNRNLESNVAFENDPVPHDHNQIEQCEEVVIQSSTQPNGGQSIVQNHNEKRYCDDARNSRLTSTRLTLEGVESQFAELSSSRLEGNRIDHRSVRSNKTVSSVRSKMSSAVSSASSHRQAIELQKIQEELDLQSKIDAEILALKLDAIKMKEKREKKFLEDKYKALTESIRLSSDAGSRRTDRSSYVSSWIEDQRKQSTSKPLQQNVESFHERIDTMEFDISIPVDPTEITSLRKSREDSKISNPGILKNVQANRLRAAQNVKGIPSSSSSQLNISTKEFLPRTSVQSIDLANDRPAHITFGSVDHERFTQATIDQIQETFTQFDSQAARTQASGRNQQMNSKGEHNELVRQKPPISTSASLHQANQSIARQDQYHPPVYTKPTFCYPSHENVSREQNRPPVYTMPTFCHSSQSTARQSQYGPSVPIIGQRSQLPVTSSQQLWNQQNQSYSQDQSTEFSRVPQTSMQSSTSALINGSQQLDSLRSNYNLGPLMTNQIAARHTVKKDLPKFYGDPCDWPRFITKFRQTTKMCGYTNDENLDRLNDCLEGKAKDIVESQLMIPDCVEEIIEMLEQKFGRPELVIKSALSKIRDEPTIKADRLEDLSNYGYKVRNLCNTIKTMGMQYHLFNPELLSEIIDKLPPQTKIEWSRFSDSLSQITLVELSDWLYSLSRSLNRITTPDISTSSSKSKLELNTKKGHVHVHDGSYTKNNSTEDSRTKNTSSQNDKPKVSSCIACSKECKNLSDCAKFKALVVEDRWKKIIEHKICRICLKRHGRRCKFVTACGIDGCVFKHHKLLHNEERHSQDNLRQASQTTVANVVTPVATEKAVVPTTTGNCHIHFDQQGEIFRIVPVILFGNGCSIKTFAFLDEGSTFTLMERHIAKKLKIDGMPEKICLLWTNKVHRQEESEIVDLEICGIGKDSERHMLKNVNVVDELDLPEQTLPLEVLKRRYEHLTNLPLIGYESATPTILIGLKHARLSVPLETIEGGVHDPIATRSRLGWSLHGPLGNSKTGFVNAHRAIKCPCHERDEEINQLIKEHFTIENFGVVVNNACGDSKDNMLALDMLKKISVRKENRFESGLLWKNEVYKLPDSYPMARKRLTCLENKGQKMIDTINESIKDYVEKGYVSKLNPVEAAKKHDRTWYLPLFTVKNPKKPEKLRTVFDAAARVKGVSLNSVLLTGPDLSTSIVDILRRFREHRIGINGDIKEMYHQVMVNEEDRHSQRFLWRDGEKDREPDEYVVNVLTFGSTCSPSTAQFIKNLNASEFIENFPRAVEAIIKNHYVDDLLDGAESTIEAVKLINDIKFVHSQGGFEIRNFKSNSVDVLKAIGELVNEDQKVSVDGGAKTERVLGMFWDTNSDCFTFSLKYTKITTDVFTGKRLPTKREVLKLLMSIFDPLGLLSYYLIHLKIFLQEIWRTKIRWDDQVPENMVSEWKRWLKILPNVEKLQIPRWYKNDLSTTTGETQLHVFVDASESAYTAVAYLRYQTDTGYSCSLVGSKARVTPIKYLSITRKELMAALLGTRLAKSIRSGISSKCDRLIIWSDSLTVLTWLHSDHRKYTQFVAHRVGEILEATNLDEWCWVPTQLNVADEATKWSKIPTFNATDRWFTAPEFLTFPEEEWPKQPKAIIPNSTEDEMRLSCSHSKLIIPAIVDPSRFSKWRYVVRSVALAIRWSKLLLAKVRKLTPPQGLLTQEELSAAERLLYRQAQWDGFTDEMITLVQNQKNPKKLRAIDKSSSIRDCTPYLDEYGVLRVLGRTDNATAVTIDAKRPIIMPRCHQLTRLLVLSYHVKFMHRNHETVINEINQQFYIPRIRVTYRTVKWNCKLCTIKRLRPRIPQMADLPAVRFEAGIRPFTFTGIDYFGPTMVMVRRVPEKRWGVLMTCLTIRAIHVELVPSISADSCIKALRNFINIRGCPREFFSDNGTHFTGADNELKRELEKLDLKEMADYFTSSYTTWKYNPPASPHMGGTWERLIRTVKSCLNESMFSRTPKEEDLRSLLLEIMNIVNSRPLTFIPLESNESEALTPNHFILGSSNGLKPPGMFTNNGPYLRSAWKEIQRCTDIFWKRFIIEYIPTLTRKTKWFDPVKPLEVGDIVINFDETQPRNTYTRARVVDTIIGSKNQVRRAKIQFADGRTLWRPAVKLGLLDLQNSAPPATESLDRSKDAPNCGENVGAAKSNSHSENHNRCGQAN